jgi:NAD(P)-dependent dehydrogenase (short-subunit alcohol dehydrogenase family)
MERARMDTIEGRGAVVTGGASGIGFAAARELGLRGARVVIGDVEVPMLEQAVKRLRAEGIDALGIPCDVRSFDQVTQLADTAFEHLSAVHIVFNNAGVALSGPIAAMDHEDWRWVIDVDLWGPIHGVEAFLPRLQEQGKGGHMLFTSSFAGLVPNIGLGAYCVAKYGVVALAEVLARELKSEGIGVSVLCPMVVATNIGASERNRDPDDGRHGRELPLTPAPAPPAAPEGSLPATPGLSTDVVLNAEDVARLTVEAILTQRLYVLPHEGARRSIRRRFERIDSTFDDQAASGWEH